MKSIQNKETEIKNVGEEGNCHYADLIGVCVRQAKQGGFDYNDIESRLAISKAVKESNGVIELEDAHFTYLKKLVESMKWSILHNDILKFKEDIISIK